MPRGRPHPRVSSNHAEIDLTPVVEETRLGDVPHEWRMVRAPTDFTPLLTIVRLADRVATRYLAGKMGMALENDARAIREALDNLPDELKGLL